MHFNELWQMYKSFVTATPVNMQIYNMQYPVPFQSPLPHRYRLFGFLSQWLSFACPRTSYKLSTFNSVDGIFHWAYFYRLLILIQHCGWIFIVPLSDNEPVSGSYKELLKINVKKINNPNEKGSTTLDTFWTLLSAILPPSCPHQSLAPVGPLSLIF